MHHSTRFSHGAQATGGATGEELAQIRGRVIAGPVVEVKEEFSIGDAIQSNNNNNAINLTPTVSLKSILTEVVHSDAANQLCRRVRPLLDQMGIVTFKKHQAIHVLRADAQRVKELGAGLV